MADRFQFRSDRARSELNPFVEKIHEFRPYTVLAEESAGFRGRWREEIGLAPDADLLLEIGPGNGFFFAEICARFAGIVGVEIRFKRVWLTANKARLAGHSNFRMVHHHSGYLGDLFAPGELSGVFINHPDPWPKDRHHKHRLLQPELADLLAEKLEPGGEVWVQSDFTPYGPLAQQVFGRAPFTPLAFTADLHTSGLLESPPDVRFWAADVETNYERKSIAKGETITLAGFRREPGPAAPTSSPADDER